MTTVKNPGPSHDVFWGEISPCEHMVQIYTQDGVFLDALEGFVVGGIKAGDGVIVIATPAHLESLKVRAKIRGVDLDAAAAKDQYIPLDAEATLAEFMVNQWPDEQRFQNVVDGLLARAGKDGRRVRAFGEMVAILWAQGCSGATVRLEHLWHDICKQRAFSLFCAYPKIGFTQNADASMKEICDAHSRVIAG